MEKNVYEFEYDDLNTIDKYMLSTVRSIKESKFIAILIFRIKKRLSRKFKRILYLYKI